MYILQIPRGGHEAARVQAPRTEPLRGLGAPVLGARVAQHGRLHTGELQNVLHSVATSSHRVMGLQGTGNLKTEIVP